MATSTLGASDTQSVNINLEGGVLEADPDGAKMTLTQKFTESQAKEANDTVGGLNFQEGLDKLGALCASSPYLSRLIGAS